MGGAVHSARRDSGILADFGETYQETVLITIGLIGFLQIIKTLIMRYWSKLHTKEDPDPAPRHQIVPRMWWIAGTSF